jgi:endonuclease III
VRLVSLVDALERTAAVSGSVPDDPYAIVLYENAGYLVDDDLRDALYRRIVELAPDARALLAADRAALIAIARDGGMRPAERVERWRAIAELTLAEADGDLPAALRALPLTKARKLLSRYPAIGAPGADRILLFSRIAAVPSVDSRGLRVLERYGVVAAGQPYARAYREACAALASAYAADGSALRRAYLILRAHGTVICRRTADCPRCTVRRTCAAAVDAERRRVAAR